MLRLALLIIPSLLMATPFAVAAKSNKGEATLKMKPAKAKYGASAFVSQAAIPTFQSEPATASGSSPASGGATIMAYKRDPVPVFDDSGSKLRDVPKSDMPKANTAAARVLGSKPGFVAIMLDGTKTWLRLTAVDYVGAIATPPCETVSTKFAKMEEDGVERSLGLGCKK